MPCGRPTIDTDIDRILESRLSARQHRFFWLAESPDLGGATPYEALRAGWREAVVEVAMGRPGADRSVRLISTDVGRRISQTAAHLPPPYDP